LSATETETTLATIEFEPAVEVRGISGLLVDAFGIPDQVLGAPIGIKRA
jgi:hypothetical protein